MDPDVRPPWAQRLVARVRRPFALARRRCPPALRTFLPWIVTVTTLLVVSTWTVVRTEPDAVATALIAVGIASMAALAAHECGHLLALLRWGGVVRPAQWTGGIVLALVLAPVGASSGPYLAERLTHPTPSGRLRLFAAGPAANLLLAAAAFGAYVLRPVPVLLLTSQISTAVAAFALLPNKPLDGHGLKPHPLAATILGLVTTAAGVAFALNAP
jgi:hypothetical protein